MALLKLAVEAVRKLAEEDGLSVKVINLPWLNEVDAGWLRSETLGYKWVLSVDNHYLKGGQGDAIARVMAGFEGPGSRLFSLGVAGVPPSGTNPEVLNHVGLDVRALVRSIRTAVGIRKHSKGEMAP